MSPRYDVPKAAPEPLRLVQRFVNTSDRENEREWIGSPAALADWLEEAGLAVDEVTDDDLARAIALREALRDLLTANNGGTPSSESVATVNDAALSGGVGVELDPAGRVHLRAFAPRVDAALGAILAVCFSAMIDGGWTRLKACRNCHWIFHDFSRNRSARWCSMTLCGNRLKTRSYRRRRAAGEDAARWS